MPFEERGGRKPTNSREDGVGRAYPQSHKTFGDPLISFDSNCLLFIHEAGDRPLSRKLKGR